MVDATGTVNFGAYKITFVISYEGGFITLYDANEDEDYTMEYEDAQVIMTTVTMLMYSETMREEFKNA